ncbi:insulinase family protein [Nitrincola nitratireducens]|nr:insulinase family protein [Nitrincola nitratireducens]
MAGVPHGRLYKTLVESGTAHGVMGLQLSFRHAGYYIFSAPIVSGHSADESLKQMTQALENLAENPLQADELERFQATVAAQQWQLLQNPGLLADVLSESAALGNWQLILDRFEHFADLTLADVQQQAETLLNANQRFTGQLLATPISDRLTDASGVSSAQITTLKPTDDKSALMNSPATAVPEFDLLAFNQQVEMIEASLERYELSNGLQIILRAQPGSGKPVQGRMTFRFGDADTLNHKRALAELTGTLIIRGTETKSFQELVDQVNRMGAGLFIQPSTGTVSVRLETPPKHLETLLTLVQEVLKQPALTQEDFDVVKRQQQQALRQTNQQPAQVANRAYLRQVERHPEGHLLRHRDHNELLAELEPLTLDDVKTFHRQFYGTNHGQLALSGDFDPETIKPLLQQLFGQWNSPAPFTREEQLHEPFPEARLHAHANALLTGHYLTYLHFPANNADEDAAALLLAERVLGRHPIQSRLSKRFRQDKGLTYGIRTSIKIANLGTDSWINIESSYPMTQGEKFADLVKDEVSKLIEFGITEEELLQAKQAIFQERQLALGQDQIILAHLPNQTYRGHTYLDWIKRNNDFATVTLDQVNAAIRKHLASAIWIEVLADRAGSKD